MRRLTRDELDEADKLGAAVGVAAKLVDLARQQLNNEMNAGVDQGSERWGYLCDGLADAIRRRGQAQTAEDQWWAQKGFTI